MTIAQAIVLADSLKPNQYPRSMKIAWLSKLDSQIFRELYKTHEDCAPESFGGYDDATPQSRLLLVPEPYAEDVYNYFLQSSIDRENGETARYNQSVTHYNNAFLAFQNAYNREHLPLSAGGFRY